MSLLSKRLTVAFGTAALVGSAIAISAAPAAAAPTCTDNFSGVWGGGTVTSGMVVCGSSGDDTVPSMTGGVFIGRGGNDTVTDKDGGRFWGNRGADLVENHNGGTFVGGYGRDEVTFMNGGTFLGGPGDDSIFDDLEENATFVGGPGADNSGDDVYGVFIGGSGADSIGGNGNEPYVLGDDGQFNGGKGKDSAGDVWRGAIFRGGPAPDTVESVDSESRALGNRGNDVVLENFGFFNGGPGTDTGGDCGGTFVSVENQTACPVESTVSRSSDD
jgi:hypothetical protein